METGIKIKSNLSELKLLIDRFEYASEKIRLSHINNSGDVDYVNALFDDLQKTETAIKSFEFMAQVHTQTLTGEPYTISSHIKDKDNSELLPA